MYIQEHTQTHENETASFVANQSVILLDCISTALKVAGYLTEFSSFSRGWSLNFLTHNLCSLSLASRIDGDSTAIASLRILELVASDRNV